LDKGSILVGKPTYEELLDENRKLKQQIGRQERLLINFGELMELVADFIVTIEDLKEFNDLKKLRNKLIE